MKTTCLGVENDQGKYIEAQGHTGKRDRVLQLPHHFCPEGLSEGHGISPRRGF